MAYARQRSTHPGWPGGWTYTSAQRGLSQQTKQQRWVRRRLLVPRRTSGLRIALSSVGGSTLGEVTVYGRYLLANSAVPRGLGFREDPSLFPISFLSGTFVANRVVAWFMHLLKVYIVRHT